MAPIVGRHLPIRGGRDGAIAQLGERVVRNDEVGGSIPPGSTTLRPSGYAWHGHAQSEGRSVPGIARRATTGFDPILHLNLGTQKEQRGYSAASDITDTGI